MCVVYLSVSPCVCVHTVACFVYLVCREQAEEMGISMRQAATRIFSNASGSYSSNVNLAVENSSWSDEQQLQEMYLSRKSFAFNSDRFVHMLRCLCTFPGHPLPSTMMFIVCAHCPLHDNFTECSLSCNQLSLSHSHSLLCQSCSSYQQDVLCRPTLSNLYLLSLVWAGLCVVVALSCV